MDCDDGADRDAMRRSGFGRGWWRETLVIYGMYGYLASIAQVHFHIGEIRECGWT